MSACGVGAGTAREGQLDLVGAIRVGQALGQRLQERLAGAAQHWMGDAQPECDESSEADTCSDESDCRLPHDTTLPAHGLWQKQQPEAITTLPAHETHHGFV